MPIGNARQQTALAEMFAGTATSSLDERSAGRIDRILAREHETAGLLVDRSRLSESHEAWVFVTIRTHPDHFPTLPLSCNAETRADPLSTANQAVSLLFGFGDARAVLTWPNSD